MASAARAITDLPTRSMAETLADRHHVRVALTRTSITVTAMVATVMIAGCASAGSTPAPATALEAATAPPTACDRYIHIDGVGSGGERTAEGALQVWLDKPASDEDPTGAPAEAPRAGWRSELSDREGYVRFSAGTWTADARQGSDGLWTVTQQGCEPA